MVIYSVRNCMHVAQKTKLDKKRIFELYTSLQESKFTETELYKIYVNAFGYQTATFPVKHENVDKTLTINQQFLTISAAPYFFLGVNISVWHFFSFFLLLFFFRF